MILSSTYAPIDSIVELQIWNGTTNSWETIDFEDSKEASIDFSLDSEITDVNDTDYYDFGNQVAFRVLQLNNSGQAQTLSVDQVIISFNYVYHVSYTAIDPHYKELYDKVGTGYSDMYSSMNSSTYQKTYPARNPQDDL